MHTHKSPFVRSLPIICQLIILLLAASSSVFAHDPGLSALDLKIDGEKLNANLTLARSDIEAMASIDENRDGQVTPNELNMARARLDAIGRDALEITIDGRRLVPSEIVVTADNSNAIHFRIGFDNATGAKLILRSALIGKLAFGHKQFLTLRGDSNLAKGARLLDAKNDLYELDLVAITEKPQTFFGFLKLGIEHILIGFDHIAFLLALLLVGGSLREAMKIITSFTAAHSITLALATLDLVNLPSWIVEPLIAVSIIYVGLENIPRREAKRRWLLTFGFGLIHGFGFATVLRELGIGPSTSGAAVPLLSFNLGVEIGQIAIAAVVLPLIWKLRQRPHFIFRYAPACSLLIALAGGYWLIQRTLL